MSKYPNLLPEKEVDETKTEVDPRDEELAKLRQEAIERDKAQAVKDAEMRLKEQQLQQAYAARNTAPTAPQASEAAIAQEELGITDEELLANPTAAIHKIAEHVSSKQLAESMQNVGRVVGNLANSTFEMELKDLSSHPYFKHIEGQLRGYFSEHPGEYTGNPGAVRSKFNELVGENLDTLRTIEESEEATETKTQRTQSIEPSITTPSHGPSPVGSPKAEEKEGFARAEDGLEDVRRDLMDTFNALIPGGLFENEEEWMAVEEGKVLPKKIAADIQVLGRKPNVDY